MTGETAIVRADDERVSIEPFRADVLTREQVQLIKATVAKGATDDELRLYLYHAQRYDLDPFRHEIWCFKYKDDEPATIMTGRDGFLKIAMRDPGFGGIQSAAVKEGDEFELDVDTSGEADLSDMPRRLVHHKIKASRERAASKPIGAWAIARHKQRPPVVCYVEFEEYNRPKSPTWQNNPSAMIQKVAEVFVLRRQYNVSGLVAREEIAFDVIEGRATVLPPRQALPPAQNGAGMKMPPCANCKKPIAAVVINGKEYTAPQVLRTAIKEFHKALCHDCWPKKTADKPAAKQASSQQAKPAPAGAGIAMTKEPPAEWTRLFEEAIKLGVDVEPLHLPAPTSEVNTALKRLERDVATARGADEWNEINKRIAAEQGKADDETALPADMAEWLDDDSSPLDK